MSNAAKDPSMGTLPALTFSSRWLQLWLSHVNASVLKVKLAMAIMGISSIHLLKTFIAAGTIGGVPLCATVAGIAPTDRIMPQGLRSAAQH